MKTESMNSRSRFITCCFLMVTALFLLTCAAPSLKIRKTEDFNKNWQFFLGDIPDGQEIGLDDSQWRALTLPHDWSIEGKFSKDNPATPGGGALPGGIGWYRKAFTVPKSDKEKLVFIDFDGVYRNSEVWINGHYLGKRPYGYSSFRYELTPFLNYGEEKNLLAVKVDNSQQPNSRWYSGSGIYRNVRLVTTEKVFVDHWGTFITTPVVTEEAAQISVQIKVRNASAQDQRITVKTTIFTQNGKKVTAVKSLAVVPPDSVSTILQSLIVKRPALWSLDNRNLYRAVTAIESQGRGCDDDETTFGIRTFSFDVNQSFRLNGQPVKIRGVCNHHDLGCLGAAINTRAIQRQLEIMKAMGVNGIRTSHNPPAPELLDLCDQMGFIVLDEAFDMWKKKKTSPLW